MFKVSFLLSVFFFASFSATTITFQNGAGNYTGCEDVTIYGDDRTESYSWHNYAGAADRKFTGHPDDRVVVFTDFHC